MTTAPITLTAMPLPAPPKGHVLAGWALWHTDVDGHEGWELRPDPGDKPRFVESMRRRLMAAGWKPVWAARPQ